MSEGREEHDGFKETEDFINQEMQAALEVFEEFAKRFIRRVLASGLQD